MRSPSVSGTGLDDYTLARQGNPPPPPASVHKMCQVYVLYSFETQFDFQILPDFQIEAFRVLLDTVVAISVSFKCFCRYWEKGRCVRLLLPLAIVLFMLCVTSGWSQIRGGLVPYYLGTWPYLGQGGLGVEECFTLAQSAFVVAYFASAIPPREGGEGCHLVS